MIALCRVAVLTGPAKAKNSVEEFIFQRGFRNKKATIYKPRPNETIMVLLNREIFQNLKLATTHPLQRRQSQILTWGTNLIK